MKKGGKRESESLKMKAMKMTSLPVVLLFLSCIFFQNYFAWLHCCCGNGVYWVWEEIKRSVLVPSLVLFYYNFFNLFKCFLTLHSIWLCGPSERFFVYPKFIFTVKLNYSKYAYSCLGHDYIGHRWIYITFPPVLSVTSCMRILSRITLDSLIYSNTCGNGIFIMFVYNLFENDCHFQKKARHSFLLCRIFFFFFVNSDQTPAHIFLC